MASYKGIEVKERVRPLLQYMPHIEEYRESLQSLQAVWDSLNLLGQMSGTTAEIGQTREAFFSLTSELLNSLAECTLAKCEQELKAKSQVAIDILTRNLFERTADIGFLATDDAIRKFAANPVDPYPLQQRFRDYAQKYSVYEDVVLLGRDGSILARLAVDTEIDAIGDDWINDVLRTQSNYVEYYGRSELFPERQRSLIYAYRVSSATGEKLGVLALCFRFDDEMQQIFRSLERPDDTSVMALLDANGFVIASSDRWQIPIGAEIERTSLSSPRLRFAGRSYLAFVSNTKGYQGYMGPGWRGLVLQPLDDAFSSAVDTQVNPLESTLLASAISGGRAFPDALQAIPRKAEAIQRDLSRSIWNGTVRHIASATGSGASFSKILLGEISRVGVRMREVFTSSIGNLQQTVLSSVLTDCQFFASLAIDIMDRNLYERANDCRWWALDLPIRRLLAASRSKTNRVELERVLRYINELYTVYENLLVFDTAGNVVAISNPTYTDLVGTTLCESWVSECLALQGSQDYCVSSFANTSLYSDRPTYIYLAPVRSVDGLTIIGGIGIVFDSESQFKAMLQDSLPLEASGTPVDGCFAVFLDNEARVIASTTESYPIDSTLNIPIDLLNPPTNGYSCLMELDGQVMAVGARRSKGYREYKGPHDQYKNDVTALIFQPLGVWNPSTMITTAVSNVASQRLGGSLDVPTVDVATFRLGDYWLGLPATEVIEAIELHGATRLPNAPKEVYGALIYRNESLPLYNLRAALNQLDNTPQVQSSQVVVVRSQSGALFGLVVDTLGEILEVPESDIEDLSTIYERASPVLASVVKTAPTSGASMLVLLSAKTMLAHLHKESQLSEKFECVDENI